MYYPDNATVSLEWEDTNELGKDRYRVERSDDYTGAGVFVELDQWPGAATLLDDRPADELAGTAVHYRVYEWVGKQKLYSDAVSVGIP